MRIVLIRETVMNLKSAALQGAKIVLYEFSMQANKLLKESLIRL